MERGKGLLAPVTALVAAVSFLLALAVRLAGLGRDPLTPEEARLALQALAWARGELLPQTAALPLYPWWTGGLFFLTQASEFWARGWPALLGAALTLVPWFLGNLPLAVRAGLALALALDPALVLASRRADGAAWALPWALLLLVAVRHRRWTAASLAALLLLATGRHGWWALAVLATAAALWYLQGRLPHTRPQIRLQPEVLLGSVWVALLGLGTYRAGLAAAFQGLVELIQGLSAPTWPLGMALWPFLAYQAPLVLTWLVLTRLGMRDHEPEPLPWAPALALAAALLWLVYPGRTPEFAIWVNLGLWPGVVWGTYRVLTLHRPSSRPLLAWLLTGLHVSLWFLFFLNLALSLRDFGLTLAWWRAALGFLALLLLGISLTTWNTLVGPSTALRHSLLAFLAVMALAQGAGWARVLDAPQNRLWRRTVTPATYWDLQATWREWSLWRHGWPDHLQALSTVTETPQLRWALRNARRVGWSTAPPLDLQPLPEAVFTLAPEDPTESPTLPFRAPVPYRGQAFAIQLRVKPWTGWTQGFTWLFHLTEPDVTARYVIFWLREDLNLKP